MRHIFIISALLFMLFPSVIFAQRVVRKGMKIAKPAAAVVPVPMYSINQLNGKWQETARTTDQKVNVDFTDTLLLSVNKGKGLIKEAAGMNMGMMGSAAIEAPAILNIAGDMYTIRKIGKDIIVLQDEEFIHSMKKVPSFYYETVGKDSIKPETYKKKEDIQFKNLTGKWQVYRRQASPGFVNETTVLVKTLSVTSLTAPNMAAGEIVLYTGSNISETFPCTIDFSGGRLSIQTKNGTILFNVYKANGSELIFGKEGELMNYAKK